MAYVIVSIKIMPESPESNLEAIEFKAKKEISTFGGSFIKSEQEPIAFGIKALIIDFSLDEEKSNLDPLEEKLREIENVQSAETIQVRRALG